MVFLQFIIITLLLLLLVRSINHDSRVDRLERFVRKLITEMRQNEISEELTGNIFNSINSSNMYFRPFEEAVEVEEVSEEPGDSAE